MRHLNILTLTFALIWNPAISQYEGDSCENENGPGICQPTKDCLAARDRRVLRTLRRCGFDENSTPLICCPNIERNDRFFPTQTETVSSTQNERVSLRECKRISEIVPIAMSYLILGGEIARLGEYPHMAALGYQQPNSPVIQFKCGGTLISNRFVITAAHCTNAREGNLSTVRLGEVSLQVDNTAVSDFGVERVTAHPNYVSSFSYYDIALLRLNRDVPFSEYIQPACLHVSSDVPTSMTITGWGNTNALRSDSSSPVLMKATVSSVNIPRCDTFYQTLRRRIPQGLNNQQLCAVNETADTCQGDSGGPIQIKHPEYDLYSVVGVTSFGRSCGSNIPAVYTKVSRYLDWIEGIVWPQN